MWFVNAPKTLTFTLGTLPAGSTVFLDYRMEGSEVTVSISATIDSLSTGACRALLTPTVAGVYYFWPRILVSGALYDIGYAKVVRVYDVPETYREES